jgi:hypothetical protein
MARTSGAGVGVLTASMAGLIAVLSTGAILRAADNMGKWATEVRAGAAATGMSVPQFSAVQGALASMGLKADEANATLRRLGVTLSQALADPTSKAAQAFHNLGITQDMLKRNGQDVSGILRLLAQAFFNTEDGANKTANLTELLGREFEKLIPILKDGAKGFDDLTAKARENGRVISEEDAKKLEELGNKVREVGEAIHSGAIPAFLAWKGPIETISEALKGLIGIISEVLTGIGNIVNAPISAIANKIQAANAAAKAQGGPTLGEFVGSGLSPLLPSTSVFKGLGRAYDWLSTTAPDARHLGPNMASQYEGEFTNVPGTTPAKRTVPPLTPPVTQDARRNLEIATAEEAASRGAADGHAARVKELEAAVSVMQRWVAQDKAAGVAEKQLIDDQTRLAEKTKELNNARLAGGGAKANQATRDFIADGKLQIAEADGNSKKIEAIYDNMLAHLRASHTATAAQISNIEREKVNAVNKARLDEIKEGAKQEEQANKLLHLNNELNAIATGKMKYQGQAPGPTADLDRSRAFIAEAEQVRAKAQAEIADLTKVRDTAEEGSNTRKAAEQEILSVEMQAKQQEIALYKEAGDAAVAAANKSNAALTSMFNGIGSQLENFSTSALKSLISPQVDLIKANN